MTINLTREDFEQAIKSGASVFEGNTIPDTGKPSGRYYRFIRVPLANGEHKVDALYGQRFYGTLENKPVTFNQEIRFLCLVVDIASRSLSRTTIPNSKTIAEFPSSTFPKSITGIS